MAFYWAAHGPEFLDWLLCYAYPSWCMLLSDGHTPSAHCIVSGQTCKECGFGRNNKELLAVLDEAMFALGVLNVSGALKEKDEIVSLLPRG